MVLPPYSRSDSVQSIRSQDPRKPGPNQKAPVYHFVYSLEVTSALLHLIEEEPRKGAEQLHLTSFLEQNATYSASSRPSTGMYSETPWINPDLDEGSTPETDICKLPEIYDDFIAMRKMQENSSQSYLLRSFSKQGTGSAKKKSKSSEKSQSKKSKSAQHEKAKVKMPPIEKAKEAKKTSQSNQKGARTSSNNTKLPTIFEMTTMPEINKTRCMVGV